MAGLVPTIHAVVSLQVCHDSLPNLGDKPPERRRLSRGLSVKQNRVDGRLKAGRDEALRG